MVQSLNTKVDLTINATSYLGMADYGKIMIGDKGFEFYNDRDARKFVQIPMGSRSRDCFCDVQRKMDSSF